MEGIHKALAEVNKGSDKKEDMVLLLSPDTNWSRFLTPAPYAISLLGELMLISSDRDFSLSENAPNDGFKYLRHPSSFRASLVQISNEGWSAFNEAHTNMDQIRLYSAGVETHIRSAVKLLLAGTKEEIELVLPNTLGKVGDIADSCRDLAQSIEEKFVRVMEVIAELLEVSTSAKGTYEKKLDDSVHALDAAKEQRVQIERDQKEMKTKCEMLEKDIKQAQDDFMSAMNKVPSGASMLALSLAEGVVNGVRGAFSIFTKESSSPVFNFMTKMAKMASNSKDDGKTETTDEMVKKSMAYNKAPGLQNTVNKIAEIATSSSRDGKEYPNLEAVGEKKIGALSATLDKIVTSFEDSDTSTSPEKVVIGICEKGKEICQTLQSLVDSFVTDADGIKGYKAATDAKNLLNEADQFAAKAKLKIGTSIMDEPSTNLRKISEGQATSSIVEATNETARFKVETSKQMLNDARERHERAYKEMKKESEQLQKVIREMATLNPKKVDFETIKSTLVKGIYALSELREEWSKLVRFFQSMSNLIKCSLRTSLRSFVESADQRRELFIKGVPVSKVFVDMLIDQSSQANRIAYAVNTIAATYVEVSDKHLMDKISGLGKLIALSGSENDQSNIAIQREKLHSGMEEAQKAITMLMNKHRDDYNSRIETRKRKLEEEIEAILPPISPKRLKEIKDTVSKGISQQDEDLEKELDDII